MSQAVDQVIELIFGRWRSQVLYAGVALGVFDHLPVLSAEALAAKVSADPAMLKRLLRALVAIDLVHEDADGFVPTEAGCFLRHDHPQSLHAVALLEEGPEHYAIWKHLVPVVQSGDQNAFVREYGRSAFDYAARNPRYGTIFDEAMSGQSSVHTEMIVAALQATNLDGVRTICDVGGGQGHLACGLLQRYPNMSAIVLELPTVLESQALWADRLGLSSRCRYMAGDMFQAVPKADVYILKQILHDWSDDECVAILRTIRRSSSEASRLFVAEFGPAETPFSMLFDIHMMMWGTGRERTAAEYADLFRRSGWRYVETLPAPGNLIGVVAAVRDAD